MTAAPNVPFLLATLFACILEDCITQLRILSECNNELRILKTHTDMGRLLTLKFHVKQQEDADHLDKIDRKELGSNQYKLNKLVADRKHFADVLEQLYPDMALNRSFSSLTASIKTIEDRNEYRAKLSEEESKNKTTRRELVRHLRQQRNHIKSVIYDTNMTVENLKYQVEQHAQHQIDGKQSVASENRVPFLLATLFACILEDCITQLRILSECNNELRILKTHTDMGRLLTLKFHVKQQEDADHLDKIDRKELGSNQYKLNKLVADRKHFADVLEQLYLDMALNRSFSSLTASIKTIEDRNEYRAKLSEEESKNKTTRRELVRHLRQQRNHIKSVIYDTNMTVENLKYRVEDTELNSETRGRFVENWQRARSEQHTQSIFDKESGPTDAIQYFQNRSDQEQRVHSEVELLVNIFINETLTKVEHWMNKFDSDMEVQDLAIAKMKNKLQDAISKREHLEETFASHDKLMKSWIQFKADRQDEINYKEKMTNSAFIVQAWWRGLLVRLEMGPYKPQRKPKANKKK